MQLKCISYLLSSLLLLVACKKKKTESYWMVNGESFSVVAVPDINKAVVYLNGEASSDNKFSISFWEGYSLPTWGAWPIGDTSVGRNQDPSYIYFVFTYKGAKYFSSYPQQNNYVHAFEYKKYKAAYQLNPTWFVKSGSSDSILISGNFYEP